MLNMKSRHKTITLERLKQKDQCRFESNLEYTVSPRSRSISVLHSETPFKKGEDNQDVEYFST